MIFTPTEVNGAYLVDLEAMYDERGSFARTWCRDEFARHGLSTVVAQTNTAFTRTKGTLRGLHYQQVPHQEAKLVRCTRGAAFVVALDLRSDSSTYARWIGVDLTTDNHRMLYVPEGCAQGYQTLMDQTEMYYQMSQCYWPDAADGVRYDDPEFAIRWPVSVTVLSEKDQNWPDYRTEANA